MKIHRAFREAVYLYMQINRGTFPTGNLTMALFIRALHDHISLRQALYDVIS